MYSKDWKSGSISFAAWHLLKSKVLEWPHSKFPSPLCSFWIRFLRQTTLLSEGTKHSFCLSPSNKFQFSASLWIIRTSLSCPPVGISVPHSWLFTLLLSATSTLRGMWCPPSPGCEYMRRINCCLSHLSSVGCCVFGQPHNPSVGIPHSSVGWRGGNQNNPHLRILIQRCTMLLSSSDFHIYPTKFIVWVKLENHSSIIRHRNRRAFWLSADKDLIITVQGLVNSKLLRN